MSEELLRQLRSAASPEERTLIVTRDLLESLPASLRAAAWAAAIPHWFDADILAALLEMPSPEAQALYASLQTLSFVEPFPGRGHNLHELTRRALLADWWTARRDEYRLLSARAAACFAQRAQPEERIESVYHLLIADEDEGIDALSRLAGEWQATSRYNLLYVLAQTTCEHASEGRLSGRASGWALYYKGQAEYRYYHNQEARSALLQALELAGADHLLRANTIQSLGDVHVMLAEYGAARQRYEEALPIYRQIGARLGEANCHLGLADIERATGNYAAAATLYRQALIVYEDIGMPFNIALAWQRLGNNARSAGDTPQARACYQKALEILERIGSPVAEQVRESLRAL